MQQLYRVVCLELPKASILCLFHSSSFLSSLLHFSLLLLILFFSIPLSITVLSHHTTTATTTTNYHLLVIISTADCHPPLSLARSPRPLDLTSLSSLLLHCYYDAPLPQPSYSSVCPLVFLHGLIPAKTPSLERSRFHILSGLATLSCASGTLLAPRGSVETTYHPLPTATVNNSS